MSAPERVGPKRGNNFSKNDDILAGVTFDDMLDPRVFDKRVNNTTGDDLLANVTLDDMMTPINSPNSSEKRKILEKLSSGNSNSSKFIQNVIDNKELKLSYNEYLNTLPEHMLNESIELYKTINSDNFRKLLNALSQGEKNLLENHIRNLLSSSERLTRISALIYNVINSAVTDNLEDHKRNSRYVFKTAKNVQSSEDIESLGMTTMTSILSNFTNYRTFNKISASKSVVFTAELAPNQDTVNVVKARNTLKSATHRLYFKMYPFGKVGSSFDFSSSGLEAERRMYSEVFKLVKYGITPNILCKVADGMFQNAYTDLMDSDRISTEVKDKIRQQIIDVNKKYNIPRLSIWKDIGLTITQPGGLELSRAFNSLTLPQRTQIMFQLMYTLYVFEKLKISHGDLHTGNIFVVDVEPTELCYIVEGVQYRFTTTKLLKIYDFDQGNITADTDITINGGETVRINRVFNYNRRSGGSFDRIYGKGEQFVRKSDLMIFIANGLRLLATNYYGLDFGGGRYPEFTHFMRTMMPGFYKPNALSQVSICDTYTELLKTATPQLIKEFREVFLIPEGEEINIDNMKIGTNICSMPWHFYYIGPLPDYSGCLVKDTTPGGIAKNNTLLIPDTIVLPLINMIHNPFFDELKSKEPIDITRQLVYTLDGKL